MKAYVSILLGDKPEKAHPLLASDSPVVVKAAVIAILRELGLTPRELESPQEVQPCSK